MTAKLESKEGREALKDKDIKSIAPVEKPAENKKGDAAAPAAAGGGGGGGGGGGVGPPPRSLRGMRTYSARAVQSP